MSEQKNYLIKNKHEGSKEEEYRIEVLSEKHLDEVLKLNRLVYDLLPNKQILSLDNYEEMYEDLNKGGVVLGVLNNENKIVAYRYASFPGLEDKNLGYDLNIPIELEKVCQLETTVVHPDFRGNDTQNRLVGIMKGIAKERGYTDLTCTVSPYNYHSLYNIMRNGLKIRVLRRKYDDLLRFVLHGKIHDYDYGKNIDTVNSSMEDIEKQMELLEKGYIGYKLYEDRTIDYVKFE